MYYIWSVIITIIIFFIIQYLEREKDIRNYKLFKINNVVLIFMIYLISTILCYFVFPEGNFNNDYLLNNNNNKNNEITNLINNTQIDPSVLKKIPDNINIGFEPFDDSSE
jgi:uncharacterized membrane protein YkvI